MTLKLSDIEADFHYATGEFLAKYAGLRRDASREWREAARRPQRIPTGL